MVDLSEESLKPLKKLSLNYWKVYGQKTKQGGDLTWEASTLKETWSFDNVVLWDYVAN